MWTTFFFITLQCGIHFNAVGNFLVSFSTTSVQCNYGLHLSSVHCSVDYILIYFTAVWTTGTSVNCSVSYILLQYTAVWTTFYFSVVQCQLHFTSAHSGVSCILCELHFTWVHCNVDYILLQYIEVWTTFSFSTLQCELISHQYREKRFWYN